MNPDLEFVRGLRERLNLKARMARHNAQVFEASSQAAIEKAKAEAFQTVANECDTYITRREAELNNGRRP